MSETFPDALRRLEAFVAELGYSIAVIGGVAIIARVRARATEDIDILAHWPRADIDRLLAAAARHGYAYDPNDRAMFEEGLVRLWGPPGAPDGVGVDMVLADSPYLEEVIARASELEISGTRLAYATVEDLVLLKLEANRPIDIDDILAIKDSQLASLDMAYLSERVKKLGLEARFSVYFGAPHSSG